MKLSQMLALRSRQIHAYRAMRNFSASTERHMQLTKEAQQKEWEYGQKALEFVAKLAPNARNNLPTIRPETAEWKAWERYFVDFLGFYPWAMKRVIEAHQGGKTDAVMTVPMQWPEWFDTSCSNIQAAE